jgi:hypothetical protein
VGRGKEKMKKIIVHLEASEKVMYDFYVEVEVSDDEEDFSWLKNEAECILYGSEVDFLDYISDNDGFQIDKVRNLGDVDNKYNKWLAPRLIREKSK